MASRPRITKACLDAPGRNTMASTLVATPAAEITARLDRLPMTRHMWMLVLLISLGGWFDTHAIFQTGSIAPRRARTIDRSRRSHAASRAAERWRRIGRSEAGYC